MEITKQVSAEILPRIILRQDEAKNFICGKFLLDVNILAGKQ